MFQVQFGYSSASFLSLACSCFERTDPTLGKLSPVSEVKMEELLHALKAENYCYLTTIGRVTGNPHEIEIWFGVNGATLYLLSGGMDKADWVRNLMKNPAVTIRIGEHTFQATARIVKDEAEEMLARNMLADKYNEREADGSLSEWSATALVVGFDVKSIHKEL